jgi:hypothetical protein
MVSSKNKSPRYIFLEDYVASAVKIDLICRDVLWGLVELIKLEVDYVATEVQADDNELPGSFGSSKGKARTNARNRDLKKKLCRTGKSISGNPLFPARSNGKGLHEHNIYRSAQLGLVEVLGNGHDAASSTVRCLGVDGASSCAVVVNRDQLGEQQDSVELLEVLEKSFWFRAYMNCPSDVHEKYWDQRYRLLSKYDYGIQLDFESWFSITPECIAQFTARYCISETIRHPKRTKIVFDCFSGCGGNTIPFASSNQLVLSIDIDSQKLISLR